MNKQHILDEIRRTAKANGGIPQRKNGEWFELSAADVKAFRRRKFM